ncbi:unnamed protein product [Dimorphilus gyrociliatus]|uniref:Uncharacterized protein n=1 Tax=Dimorphilus gyrociliatus TaxID=2664684 RepID=A0A7I8WBW9_9ANNE|nr:unnamed protein product [Dimorphilus gyrociliatus]
MHILLFCSLIANAFSSKILLLPSDDSERIRSFAPLSDTLAVGGHEVLTLSSSKHAVLLGDLQMPHVLYKLPAKIQGGLDSIVPSPNFYQYLTFFERAFAKQNKICEEFLKSDMLENLKEKKFNYAIIDGRREAICLKNIAKSLNIRYSMLHSDFSSVDLQYSIIDGGFIIESLQRILLKFMYNSKLDSTDVADLHMINTDIVCSSKYYPLSPHIIHLNLMRKKTKGILRPEIGMFLKKWKKSIIVLYKRKPTKEQITSLFNIFRMMSFGIIVEYRGQINEKPDNVLISDYLPLHELFAHSQEIAVVLSVDSLYYHQMATAFGIPTIVVAQNFETYSHINSYYKKSNIILLDDINLIEVEYAFSVLGSFKKAKKASKICSERINAMPSPSRAALFWIDHAMEFGSRHLRKEFSHAGSVIFRLTFVDYFILLLSFSFLVLITFICIKLTIRIVDLITNQSAQPKAKAKPRANNVHKQKELILKEDKRRANGINHNLATNVKRTKKKKFY